MRNPLVSELIFPRPLGILAGLLTVLVAIGCNDPITASSFSFGLDLPDPPDPSYGLSFPSPAAVEIPVGDTFQLTATFLDASGGPTEMPTVVVYSGPPPRWRSDNVGVATVADGLVRGIAVGSTRIWVTAEGFAGSGSTEVTVVPSYGGNDDGGNVDDGRILIDASHGCGIWWFPQVGPFVPEEDHQGRAFAEYLRSRGYVVDELPPGTLITDSQLAPYKYVIRFDAFTEYRSSELDAYGRFVERDATLLLVSGQQATSPGDGLAEALGVTFTGNLTGVLTRYVEHPITDGIASGSTYQNGAIATAFNSDEIEILAWVNDTVPVMGVIRSHEAKVFFSGIAFPFLDVPQPLVDNLLGLGFDLP